MSGMIGTYTVEMEDGTTYSVKADQRDSAAFELQPFGVPTLQFVERLHTYSRFRAWNAGRRKKLHTLTWDEFQDQCVEVTSPDEESEEGGADPGNSAASAESSSN